MRTKGETKTTFHLSTLIALTAVNNIVIIESIRFTVGIHNMKILALPRVSFSPWIF